MNTRSLRVRDAIHFFSQNCSVILGILRHSAFAAAGTFFTLLHPLSWFGESCTGVTFYKGRVFHARTKPVKNSFAYPLRFAVIELDNPPYWYGSSGQANEHLTAGEARGRCGTNGRVRLLTIPRVFGYSQNPISIYYCYSRKATENSATLEQLQKCIAEVTNTPWGERVCFDFEPNGHRVPKSLHVSPFMDMLGDWEISATDPGCEISVRVNVVGHPVYGDFFHASLKATIDTVAAHARSERAGIVRLLAYACSPHRVVLWIYYQALVLIFNGAQFFSPPQLEETTAVGEEQRKVLKLNLDETKYGSTVTKVINYTVNDVGCPLLHSWREAKAWPWKT